MTPKNSCLPRSSGKSTSPRSRLTLPKALAAWSTRQGYSDEPLHPDLPIGDYERRVRAGHCPARGSLQSYQAAYLPEAPEDILRQQTGEPPEVLILGPGLPLDEALKFAAVLDLQYPEISIVLTAEDDGETALNAMRSGIRDILSPAADSDTVRALVERASLAAAGRTSRFGPDSI